MFSDRKRRVDESVKFCKVTRVPAGSHLRDTSERSKQPRLKPQVTRIGIQCDLDLGVTFDTIIHRREPLGMICKQ